MATDKNSTTETPDETGKTVELKTGGNDKLPELPNAPAVPKDPTKEAIQNMTGEGVLSDGRAYKIRKLKGRDFVESQNLVGAKQEHFYTAGISLALTIDGAKVKYEDLLDNESYEDYMTLYTEFMAINFSSALK